VPHQLSLCGMLPLESLRVVNSWSIPRLKRDRHTASRSPHAMRFASGVRLGPFEILAPLGAGGMGEVYRARDTRLDRTVAIKLLPSEVLNASGHRVERFCREARVIARITHQPTCTLYDVGDDGPAIYLVMEYVDGVTRHAVPGHQFGLQLTAEDKAALIAFLKTSTRVQRRSPTGFSTLCRYLNTSAKTTPSMTA
jgi:serine/threonine protein kinase